VPQTRISSATSFQWKSKYSGVQAPELRLRELEVENAKHKCMHADLAREASAIKDVLKRKS
jgi:putative transposase